MRIVVDEEESDWDKARLSVRDALRLARAPLKLLVENRRNDYAFLHRIVSPSWRRALDEAVDKGWLEVEHSGGLGEMSKLVKELTKAPEDNISANVRRLRLCVLFDRDASHRDRSQPSEESERVRKLCEERPSPWQLAAHQLRRRAIENYLPRKTLFAWAERARGRVLTNRHGLLQ